MSLYCMTGLCHICLRSDVDITVKGNLLLCKDCLNHVVSLEKNNLKKDQLSVIYN